MKRADKLDTKKNELMTQSRQNKQQLMENDILKQAALLMGRK